MIMQLNHNKIQMLASSQQNLIKLYTLNYTSDFASDSSSNYIKVYKMTGLRFWNDGMPIYPFIRILAQNILNFIFLDIQ